MHLKRIFIVCIIILISTSIIAGAQTLTSQTYTLIDPKIVVSGGKASSFSYTLNEVEIGNVFGGKASSASYALDTKPLNKIDGYHPPNPPTLTPVTTPTNISTQTLSGTKQLNTAIYINGYERVSLSDLTDWSYEVSLAEGDNHFIITAKNYYNLESEPVYVTIALDTIPPFIVINDPLDGTIVYTSQISVEGIIDGNSFTETKDLLNFGLNPVTIEASDEAGNTSYESIEVYLIREPISLPQEKP